MDVSSAVIWTLLVFSQSLLTRFCVDGPSEMSWTPLCLRILPRLPGFHLRVVGVESSSAEVVAIEAGPGFELDSEADFQGI